MKVYSKFVSSIARHSPYLDWAKEGKAPGEIKRSVLAILEPHFEHPERLADIPISVLAHEAVTMNRIQQDSWASAMFTGVLSEYRGALARDSQACLIALENWDEPVLRAMSEFISIYLMEVDKTDLDHEEFRLEILRNVGGMLEACLQPQLKALLHQTRIRQGRLATAAAIMSQKFGVVVEELSRTLMAPGIVAPPPWGLKLHHWRNIAQHHSAVVQGDVIVCQYHEGKGTHRIVLKRNELLALAHTLQDILGIVRAARSIFIADQAPVPRRRARPLTLRPEIAFFETAVGIATQGFEIVSLEVDDEAVHLFVRDVTAGDPKQRMIHASQFVVPTWQVFQKSTVHVTYIDREGRKRLETTANGKDCEEIAEERVAFSTLAERVTFRVVEVDSAGSG